MKTTIELVTELTQSGSASIELANGLKARDARSTLIGAARAAGVRVTCTREGPLTVSGPDRMVGTVLTAEEATTQARRSAYLRASRSVKDAVTTLRTELITADAAEAESTGEIIFDLAEITADLEKCAV